MNTKIDVSIIIPCTDRIKGLSRCINSVLEQSTSSNLEIILVENNSTNRDLIAQLVFSFDDERIKHHYLESCDNANIARNHGVLISEGAVVAFLDSDDWWGCKHVEQNLKLIDDGAKALYSGFILDNGIFQERKYARQINNETAYNYLFGKNAGVAQTSSFFMKKNIFDVCKWDENLRRSQDYDFFIQVQNKIGWTFNALYSVYVSWEEGEQRKLSPDSYIKFYNKHGCFMSDKEKAEYLCEIIKAVSTYSKEEYIKFSCLIKDYKYSLSLLDNIYIFNYYITFLIIKVKTSLKKSLFFKRVNQKC